MADRASGKNAVRDFVYDRFMPTVLSVNSPAVLNVENAFATYLRENGWPELVANEMAEKWQPNLVELLHKELSTWEARGLARPACFMDLENDKVVLTWRHKNYKELTGRESLDEHFFGVLDWVRSLDSRHFLIPNLVLLSELGADRVYITEGGGDGGVDLIGVIGKGPLRSTGLFVQAKTSSKRVTRDKVLLEYAKYMSLPRSERFRDYLNALGLGASMDGSSLIYIITANNQFESSAQKIATNLGILLRSDVQLANYVKSRYQSRDKVEEMYSRAKGHLSRDLQSNALRLLE